MKACSLMWCGLLVDTYLPDSRNQRGMNIMDWMLFYLLLNMICWSLNCGPGESNVDL